MTTKTPNTRKEISIISPALKEGQSWSEFAHSCVGDTTHYKGGQKVIAAKVLNADEVELTIVDH